MSLYTSRARVADIVARAKREHPYEVPGVSARPIIDGNPDYVAWIAKATGTRARTLDPAATHKGSGAREKDRAD